MGPMRDARYDYFGLKWRDRFGLVVPRGCGLAAQGSVDISALPGLPLLLPEQTLQGNQGPDLMGLTYEDLHIAGVYNLFYNATHMVEHGLGFALCLEGLIDESTTRSLEFISIQPEVSVGLVMATKRYQTFSPAVRLFLERLRAPPINNRRVSEPTTLGLFPNGRISRKQSSRRFTAASALGIARFRGWCRRRCRFLVDRKSVASTKTGQTHGLTCGFGRGDSSARGLPPPRSSGAVSAANGLRPVFFISPFATSCCLCCPSNFVCW